MDVKKGNIYIGTSGWSNANWKGSFYPEKAKSKEFLAFYSQHLNATEINSTFYHIPRITTVEGWMTQVPADFKLAVKMSKYITHIKRLKEPEEPLDRFFTAIASLKKYIGPILIQLPPSLKFVRETAEHFFEVLKQSYQSYTFVLEARHASWFEVDALSLLHSYDIALVMSESGGRYPLISEPTAQSIYIRFHGPDKLFDSPHSDEMLADYAKRILKWQKQGHDVWVFFNNTIHQDALNNARTLMGYLKLKTSF